MFDGFETNKYITWPSDWFVWAPSWARPPCCDQRGCSGEWCWAVKGYMCTYHCWASSSSTLLNRMSTSCPLALNPYTIVCSYSYQWGEVVLSSPSYTSYRCCTVVLDWCSNFFLLAPSAYCSDGHRTCGTCLCLRQLAYCTRYWLGSGCSSQCCWRACELEAALLPYYSRRTCCLI